jgi:ankyrin repeat protein
MCTGALVDYANEDGFTALMFAARNGHKETVEALLTANADVTKRNLLGRNAMHYAALV